MQRFDAVGSETAVHVVVTSTTSMLANIAFRGWEWHRTGTKEATLGTRQNPWTESQGQVQPELLGLLLGGQV
ncbi:hypothetical protein ABVK25_011906 [Lepraria finkii]|uniref:Uncharacterized protein n=1 Tax=Lepraria finkii TaxID=1340010 RepID=A0ABR4AKC0_9LECA